MIHSGQKKKSKTYTPHTVLVDHIDIPQPFPTKILKSHLRVPSLPKGGSSPSNFWSCWWLPFWNGSWPVWHCKLGKCHQPEVKFVGDLGLNHLLEWRSCWQNYTKCIKLMFVALQEKNSFWMSYDGVFNHLRFPKHFIDFASCHIRFCSVCQRMQYHANLRVDGILLILPKKMLSRWCRPAWTTVRYVRLVLLSSLKSKIYTLED